jgi:hypothetical protein
VTHRSAEERKLTERYVLGELDAAESAEFEEHFFGCAACAEEVRRASRVAANLRAVLRDDEEVLTIEASPSDRFLDLTVLLRASTRTTSRIQCEFHGLGGSDPVVVTGSLLGASLRLLAPVDRLATGPCTLVLRDSESGDELERRSLFIAKRARD